jgi:hypothetical protein
VTLGPPRGDNQPVGDGALTSQINEHHILSLFVIKTVQQKGFQGGAGGDIGAALNRRAGGVRRNGICRDGVGCQGEGLDGLKSWRHSTLGGNFQVSIAQGC